MVFSKNSIRANWQTIGQGLWEWNPQLFREIRGRVKTRNLIVTFCISCLLQLIVVVSIIDRLPKPVKEALTATVKQIPIYSRYCFGAPRYEYSTRYLCQTDLLNNWLINWQFLWFDIFVWLSLISIISLLVIGTYVLAADLVKEENRGTLNFIRLSPQSAGNVLLGKVLGVPILLYVGVLLAFPLHLIAGLQAYIPLNLILIFDLVVIAGCAFFYCAALLISLTKVGLVGLKPWLASGITIFFLCLTTGMIFDRGYYVNNDPFDWLTLFYPGRALAYLVDATSLSPVRTGYANLQDLQELLFYGQAWWTKAGTGLGLILLNYGLWTSFLWSMLKRRFHNPESTLLSKTTSYWLTSCFVVVSLGFALQTTHSNNLEDNLIMLQGLLLIFFLTLTAALSPHRQTLQDWARYRHQLKKSGNVLWQELVWGEKSPSSVAVLINLIIATIYILPSLFLFPLRHETATIFWGFLLSANIILFYSVVAQSMLFLKSHRRAVWSSVTILSLIVVPPIGLQILDLTPGYAPAMWLFTFLPVAGAEYATGAHILLAILGQWLAISLVGWQMTRKLHQAGASETKVLLASTAMENKE